MKRGYSKKKYHQRSKVETIFPVIKRTMGDEIRSVKTVAQNNEMRTKIICYNATRIVGMASSLLRGFLQSRSKALLFKENSRGGYRRNRFTYAEQHRVYCAFVHRHQLWALCAHLGCNDCCLDILWSLRAYETRSGIHRGAN